MDASEALLRVAGFLLVVVSVFELYGLVLFVLWHRRR